jgi:hypothetical protein
MNTPLHDFAHSPLNTEITAIGGYYVVIKETRLPYRNEEVLYFIGNGIVDRTCCGFGAFYYATVAGYIRQWQYKKNDLGQPVTQVEPVTDDREQTRIQQMIRQADPLVTQVNFMV